MTSEIFPPGMDKQLAFDCSELKFLPGLVNRGGFQGLLPALLNFIKQQSKDDTFLDQRTQYQIALGKLKQRYAIHYRHQPGTMTLMWGDPEVDNDYHILKAPLPILVDARIDTRLRAPAPIDVYNRLAQMEEKKKQLQLKTMTLMQSNPKVRNGKRVFNVPTPIVFEVCNDIDNTSSSNRNKGPSHTVIRIPPNFNLAAYRQELIEKKKKERKEALEHSSATHRTVLLSSILGKRAPDSNLNNNNNNANSNNDNSNNDNSKKRRRTSKF